MRRGKTQPAWHDAMQSMMRSCDAGRVCTCACSARAGFAEQRRQSVPDPSEAVPLQVVVVAELGASLNGLPCKDANVGLSLDHPVLRLAVRATRVVQVPCEAALGCRVQQEAPAPRLAAPQHQKWRHTTTAPWGPSEWRLRSPTFRLPWRVAWGLRGSGSSLDVCHDVCVPHVSVCAGHTPC